MVDVLEGLVRKSMIDTEDSTGSDSYGARFRTRETVRQYALARLREWGREQVLRVRHLDYFTRRSREVRDGVTTVEALLPELANLRAAQEWSIDAGGIEEETTLVVATVIGEMLVAAGRVSRR